MVTYKLTILRRNNVKNKKHIFHPSLFMAVPHLPAGAACNGSQVEKIKFF